MGDLPGSPDILSQPHGLYPVADLWIRNGVCQTLLFFLSQIPADKYVLKHAEHVPFG